MQRAKHNSYQRNLWGVGKRQFLTVFKGPLTALNLQWGSYAPSATNKKLTMEKFNRFLPRDCLKGESSLSGPADLTLTSGGQVLDQELVFRFF